MRIHSLTRSDYLLNFLDVCSELLQSHCRIGEDALVLDLFAEYLGEDHLKGCADARFLNVPKKAIGLFLILVPGLEVELFGVLVVRAEGFVLLELTLLILGNFLLRLRHCF